MTGHTYMDGGYQYMVSCEILLHPGHKKPSDRPFTHRVPQDWHVLPFGPDCGCPETCRRGTSGVGCRSNGTWKGGSCFVCLVTTLFTFTTHLQVEVDYVEREISISGYPLSAALTCAKLCSAFEEGWAIQQHS